MLTGTKWLIAAALTAPVALAGVNTTAMAVDPADPTESPSVSESPSSISPSPTEVTPTVVVPSVTPTPVVTIAPELAMETQLSALGLPTGVVDGMVTAGTKRGMCVFRDLTGRKATRNLPTPQLMQQISSTTELPELPRRLRSVKAIVSLTCQAAYITDGAGTILRVLSVSTGKDNGVHRTRPGFKRVYWKYNGWQRSALYPEPDGRPGLYRPIYFDRGIAFHGVRKPVRTYPQSHACVRTWPADQDWLWNQLKVRDKVFVYGDYWRGRSASLGGYGKTA